MSKSYNDYERHGMKHTATYRAWARMLSRCKNLKWSGSLNYGQRGISFDPRWNKFSAFYADMGVMPEGTSLDRIDPEKNYCKENCRWATREQQNRNRRVFVNSTTGVAGVTKEGKGWRVRVYHKKIRLSLYKGLDFFEACCIRKSWENRYERRYG